MIISVTTVTVDTHAETVTCGGVKLQGLRTSSSARQINTDVITEEARFLPYLDVKPADTLVDIKILPVSGADGIGIEQYALECSKMSFKILQKVANSHVAAEGKIPNKEFLEELSRQEVDVEVKKDFVEKCLVNPNCGIMQCLDKVYSLPESENFTENLKNVLEALDDEVKKDILMTNLYKGNIIKNCIAIVNENCKTTGLRILTMSRGMSSDLVDRLVISLEHEPLINANVSRSTGNGQDTLFANFLSNQPLLSEKSDPYHLVMVDGLLSEAQNLNAILSQLAAAVIDDGFVLLKETTHNLNVTHLLQRFFRDCTEIEDSELRDFGTFVKKESWENLFRQNSNFTLVSSFSDFLMSSVFLLRKLPSQSKQDVQMVVHFGTTEKFGWLPVLQEKLELCEKKPKGHNLWLVVNGEPSCGIVGMVKCLVKEPAGKRIR